MSSSPSLLSELEDLLREGTHAAEAWRAIELPQLQESLTEEALSIADRHEASLAARQALGNRVRQFRAAATAATDAAAAGASDAAAAAAASLSLIHI